MKIWKNVKFSYYKFSDVNAYYIQDKFFFFVFFLQNFVALSPNATKKKQTQNKPPKITIAPLPK